ncbi:MAG: NADH-quinone oxidoreductase subunit N, partial [Alphaproteobacteria bacterium]|nr:NADH-quinone oxidoreductase subunit N [Alphaproteobacteria bacterium]
MIPLLPKANLALPEIILAVSAMALMMVGAFRRNDATRTCAWLGMAGLLLAFLVLIVVTPARQVTFHGQFVADYFAMFMKVLVL